MKLAALKVQQWLADWDFYQFTETDRQRKPEPHFFVSSIPAPVLRRLSNIPRRGTEREGGRQQASGPRAEDIGIQRGFEKDRSDSIEDFMKGGYPWATLRKADQDNFISLKKPGWLPTAVVVNVLTENSDRDGIMPNPADLVRIEQTDSQVTNLLLPAGSESPTWEPEGPLHPLEVIDGQHRLLAFTPDAEIDGNFELPVVLFRDLDISWQAYLFWTINISPKRIGPSLAYDLYPLLRTEEWLEPVPGPVAYRETRAQELTEALWSYPNSPWYQRIGMFGRERGKVTQAAFVRSLTESFIRRSDAVGGRPGGLFGAPLRNTRNRVLPWSRSQQAAYLIYIWAKLEQAITNTTAVWADQIRRHAGSGQLPMFSGSGPRLRR